MVRRSASGSPVRGPVGRARAALLAPRGHHPRTGHRCQRGRVRRVQIGAARRAAVRASTPTHADLRALPRRHTAPWIAQRRNRQRHSRATAFVQQPRRVLAAARRRLSQRETPQMVKAMFIEPQLLRTLGVSPARGGGMRDDDGLHDTTTVVMVSHAAWQRLFNGDPSAVGKTIRLNGIPRTVVGIMPRGFVPPEGNPDFFQPLGISLFMTNPIRVRGSHNFGLVARLKPGVTEQTAT
ncbi:MAG TPA: ABC transporter permease, partial [Gemmatimonadaceae bacterium]|nr:ABC transporter permease [Gemmatimonadaceae bacterium]